MAVGGYVGTQIDGAVGFETMIASVVLKFALIASVVLKFVDAKMVDGDGKSSNGRCGILMAGSPSVLTPSHSEMDEGKMVVVSANDCDTGASGLRASEEMTVVVGAPKVGLV